MTPERVLLLRLLWVDALPACWKREIEAVVWAEKPTTEHEREAMREEAERMSK